MGHGFHHRAKQRSRIFLGLVVAEAENVTLQVLASVSLESTQADGANQNTNAASEKAEQDTNVASEKSKLQVPVEQLLSDYESKKSNEMKVRHPGWQAETSASAGTDIMVDRAFVVFVANKVLKYCTRVLLPLFDHIECFKQPRRMAIAKVACPAGMLVIAPENGESIPARNPSLTSKRLISGLKSHWFKESTQTICVFCIR